MKTFIAAITILVFITGFIFWNAWDIHRTLTTMLTLTEALPTEATEFEKNDQNDMILSGLTSLWEQKLNRIALTITYSQYYRTDEALLSLTIHYQNGNAEDFSHARLLLWDSLNHLKILEGFHFV